MTTTNDDATVRLEGRTGLLAAVPHLLGFHPAESLVLVCLSGPRRRVGPVMRVDLGEGTETPGSRLQLIAELQSHVRRHADEVALLCYTERARCPALLVEMAAALEAAGADVLDVVVVRGTMADDDPQGLAMAAASAWSGRGVLADRQALRDSIAGPTGADARAAAGIVREAADRLSGTIGTAGPIDRDELRRLAGVTVDLALRRVTSRAGVPPATGALLGLLWCDPEIRDGLIARAVTDLDAPWLPMLIAVARGLPDDEAAEVCAVLSLAAYRRGDGALAQVAVDRCLAVAPDHRLAHVMLGVMAAGLPPAELEGLSQ